MWAAWAGQSEPRPWLSAGLGLFKIPFGREVQGTIPTAFLERSRVVQALFPGEYDLGLRLHGAFRFLRYAVALMNGAPAGDVQFALRDPNRSKDLLGGSASMSRHGTGSRCGSGSRGCGDGL